ncbi:MAG: insulinase family protein, partial [Candidatus Cloacimonetes bacterium]|nr:insulinase family protein [Candidatus Cloacimonadota bacterium]
DSYAHSLIMKTFAIGKNSRLYKRLFTEEKLIDYLKVHSLSGLNNGIAILLVMPKKKADLDKIIQIFHFELNLLQKFGLTDSEIHETKKEMIYFYRYSYEYVESLGSSLGSEELLTGFENYQKYPKYIRNLKKEHLDEVISKYLQTDKLTIYHLGGRKLKIDDLLITLKESGKSRFTNGLSSDFYQTVLDNGLRIILKKVSGKPTIGISLTGEVSQLNERESNLGINLLTSGLLLYGNQKRDYNHLLNFCSSNGINCSISPDPETTSVKMKCFQESLPLSLELLSEIISYPQFPGKHLFNLKETYLSNIDRIEDYPQYNAIKLWKEHFFGRSSNLVNIEGNKSTIRRLSRKQVVNWFNNYYIPKNMTLALAGDFNFNHTLKNCEKLFSRNSQSTDILMQEPSFTLPAKKYKKAVQDNDQAIITLGGFGCTALQIEKNTAFHVLAQIIGGDTNSILFRELREKRGLVYSVDFDFFSIRQLGYFMITAIVDKAEKSHTLSIIKDILNDIKTNGILTEDLEKTKNYIRGQRLLEEESMLSRAQTLAILETLGFGYEFYLERERRLNAVNLRHLHEVAAEYFRDDNYYIHVLA